MIDHPICLFFRKHKWVHLSPNIALWACKRCGKVIAKEWDNSKT